MDLKVSLKSQNIPLIIIFLVWSITLYVLFIVDTKNFCGDLMSLFGNINAKDGIILTLAPLIAFIMSNFLSSKAKAVLVFWKLKNPLPGCRAFSEIGPKDPRIDMNIINDKIVIPTNPEDQNRVWYKISKKFEDTVSVSSSHREFLLARDLTSISFLFLTFTPCTLLIIGKDTKIVLMYVILWLTQYIILCKVSQNNGERFVSNVLAEFCSESSKIEK